MGSRGAAKGSFVDERDNKTYQWVRIGEQVWMAENLNFMVGIGSWCYSANVLNKMTGKPDQGCYEYGRLYNWETAQNSCPEEWHLPSDEEWNELIQTFGSEGKFNQKAKIGNFMDFNPQLGGFKNEFSVFRKIGSIGYYWSSSEIKNEGAYHRFDNQSFVLWYNAGKNYGFSIRCVQDK